MKKKLIATVMAATMAVTALTGCGSSSSSSAKKDINDDRLCLLQQGDVEGSRTNR